MSTTAKLITIAVGAFVLIIVISIVIPFGIIGVGERGVVFNNFSGLEKGRILTEGTYWRTPFAENVISMPVSLQKSEFTEQAGTNDSQIVNIKLTVNWHLDPGKVDQVYDTFKTSSVDGISSLALTNNVQDSIKAAVSHYQALDIQRKRDNVTADASTILQTKLKKYHIIVDGVSFTDIAFAADFTNAIEAAQVSTQRAVQAQNEQAVATAQKVITETNADAQAYQQKVLQESLTPALLEKMWIEKWNGVLPNYSFGNSSEPLPIFNLNK